MTDRVQFPPLTETDARFVWRVLVEVIAVPDDFRERENFIRYATTSTRRAPIEWRTGGLLGMRGKLVYDGCEPPKVVYPEDGITKEIDELMGPANVRLYEWYYHREAMLQVYMGTWKGED